METAFVDCFDSDELLTHNFREEAILYCLRKNRSQAPNQSLPYDFDYELIPGVHHFTIESEIELGYRLCQLPPTNLVVYTIRSDTSVFETLRIRFVQLVPRSGMRAPPPPSDIECQADLITIKTLALPKYLAAATSAGRPVKSLSQVINQIKNYVGGAITSKKVPPERIPSAEAIAASMCQRLEDLKFITVLSTGKVEYNDIRIRELMRSSELQREVISDGGKQKHDSPQRREGFQGQPTRFSQEDTAKGEKNDLIVQLARIVFDQLSSLKDPTLGALHDMSTRLVTEVFENEDPTELLRVTREVNRTVFALGCQVITPDANMEEMMRNPSKYRRAFLQMPGG